MLTLAALKVCVHEGLDGTLAEGLAVEAREMSRLARTDDAQEGVRSFVEKRPPVFRGS